MIRQEEEIMPRRQEVPYPTVIAAILAAAAIGAPMAGELDPPGPPAPTMKTLSEVEPRVPISAPIIISAPGSYYLTANIDSGGGPGIQIEASGVTLDLMGFTLSNGTGHGIFVTQTQQNIEVRNGRITGFTEDGVHFQNPTGPITYVATASRLVDLFVSYNDGTGIRAGTDSSIIRGVAYLNGEHGLWAGTNSVIIDSISRNNSADGIGTLDGTLVSNCTARFNGGNGITLADQGRVVGSVARSNTGDGIRVQRWCRVTENIVAGNSTGIRATLFGNRIDSNHTMLNGTGLQVEQGGNFLENNVSVDNTSGDSIAGGNSLSDAATAAAQAAEAAALIAGTTAQTAATNAAGAVTAANAAEAAALIAGTTAQTAATNAAGAVTAANAAEVAALSARDPRTPIRLVDIPMAIGTPGSYVLVEDILHTGTGDGIQITADDVTIDLNGFTLAGTPTGGSGIQGLGIGLVVRNGLLRGWGQWGLSAGDNVRLSDVEARENQGGGLKTGSDSLIVRCTAMLNAEHGIRTEDRTAISESLSSGNGGAGFLTGSHATITGCTASANSTGIDLGPESVVAGCTVSGNAGDGVRAAGGAEVTGATVSDNLSHGIVVLGDATVARNHVARNTLNGIKVDGSGCRIDDNNAVDNGDHGIRDMGGGNLIIRNSASGNPVNFSIQPSSEGVISLTIATAGPWDNHVY